MRHVLAICHANRWRSPLCAVVMRRDLIDHAIVRSAGFREAGRRAGKPIRDAAVERGYDLEEHRSTMIDLELLKWADLVVYMDGGNYRRLRDKMNGTMPDVNIIPLGSWATPRVSRIPDPAFMRRDSVQLRETVELIISASHCLAHSLIG